MASKRKRDEFDDSDEEEPTLGKQVLPVANLPVDFDGVPLDGLQHLFTVRYVSDATAHGESRIYLLRRDARMLPGKALTHCGFERRNAFAPR